MNANDKKYCPVCGYSLEAYAAFCPSCGRAQPGKVQQPANPPFEPEKRAFDPNPYASDMHSAAGVGFSSSDERNLAMLAHLLQIFTGFIGPLIIWLIKKDDSTFVDDQAKEVLNFQITFVIAGAALFVLTVVTCGMTAPLFVVLPILPIVFGIIATIKVKDGIRYRYPLTIRLLK